VIKQQWRLIQEKEVGMLQSKLQKWGNLKRKDKGRL